MPVLKSFTFGFSSEDLVPLIQMQQVAQNSVLSNFSWQSLQDENLMRRQRTDEVASIIATASNADSAKIIDSRENKVDKTEKESTTSYVITYYNPELQKTEVLQEKTNITIKDYTTKVIEESLAAQTAYPIYQYIGAPLMRTEVLPWKLQQILDERDYGTPPPPPAGASVTPIKLIEQKESEIAAEKKRNEIIKAAFSEVIIRKEKSEAQVAEEILVLEYAVSALRKGEEIDKVIERLPPLSRARYILAMRKKLLGREATIQLLLRDISFLKSVQKKLELFTLDDLVNMFKIIRTLQKNK